jgi:small subunit ribosomal protein S15
MARMHSRKKGKAGSKKPLKKTKPVWVRYTPKEIELLVTKMAKEGKTSAVIGIKLRDSYGIPDVKTITKKSISQIMKENKLAPEIPQDLLNLIRRAITIRKHLEENHKDMPALRGLQLTESKVKRLVKYYKKTEELSLEWKLDFKNLKIYAE